MCGISTPGLTQCVVPDDVSAGRAKRRTRRSRELNDFPQSLFGNVEFTSGSQHSQMRRRRDQARQRIHLARNGHGELVSPEPCMKEISGRHEQPYRHGACRCRHDGINRSHYLVARARGLD